MKTAAYLSLFMLLFILGCSTFDAGDKNIDLSFDEFEKILTPRAKVLLEGEEAMLVLIAMPGDSYAKVYHYDFKTKKFSLDYDHGRNISGLTEDRTGRRIYLHIDNNGDENTKIYTYDREAKKPNLLFGKDNLKSYVINTDQKGQTLFFISNYENKAVYSVYKMSFANKKIERISDGKTNIVHGIVSPEGDKFVGMRALSNNENQLFLINPKTKSTKLLFKKKASIFSPAYFDKSGENLFGSSDYKRDRIGCARIPLKAPNSVYYVREAKDKDISCGYAEWSGLYFLSESYKGRNTLSFYKKPFTNKVKIPKLFENQSVQPVTFDRKTGHMYLQYTAANNPGSLYKVNLKTQEIQEVLDYNRSSISRDQLAKSYDFEYKSFDGLNIHGILYARPEWKASGKKYPLVVWPHGGPDSHEKHNYRKWFQYLVLNGFVVFAPNFRGSTGYGKKFETLNDGDWGGGHVQDLVSGREAVEKLPWIDEKNTFLYGASFGGYSTLATVAFHPESFKAAVAFVAIGNLLTFMKSIPPDEAWQTEFIKEIGDPVKDRDFYIERSPFFHVSKIKMPLQIYQAENDIRTVKPEMDDFVAEMRKQGKSVDYTVLKDVGHGIERPEAVKKVVEGSVQFFRSHIE